MKTTYFFIIAALMLAACEKNTTPLFSDIPKAYMRGDSAIQAYGDSARVSFAIKPSSTKEMPVNIFVYISGSLISDKSRTVNIIVDAANTTASADEYSVPATVTIPAGANRMPFQAVLKRSARLRQTEVKLTLKISPSGDFGPFNPELSAFRVIWNDIYTKPASWSNIQWLVGEYSEAKYRLIIDATGISEYGTLDYGQQGFLQAKAQLALNDYNLQHPGEPLKNAAGEPIGICGTCK
jgi:hypothetical protein